MAVYIDNITETLIIPEGSVERFVQLPVYEDADGWFNSGVNLVGISQIKPGYVVNRPHCGHHAVLFCTGGILGYECETIHGEIRAGEKLLLPAGYRHRYFAGREMSMFWFHLSATHSRWQYFEALKPLAGKALYAAECERLLEVIYGEGQVRRYRSNAIPRAYCQLVTALLDGEFETDMADNEIAMRQRLQKVLNAAGMNLRRAWTVPQLAKIAALSPSHFHAVFVRTYGQGPMSIIKKMRVEQAKSMLQHSRLTLEAIAEMVGYGSAFSFSGDSRR